MNNSSISFKNQAVAVCGILLLIFLSAGCTGPEGPMGRDGKDGVDGVDGIDGINYTRSILYDIEASEWEGDLNGYNVSLDVPEINDDIYYNGAVLVYRLIETDPKSFNMLPYSYVDNSLVVYMDFDAFIGSINIIYKEVLSGANNTPAPEGLMSFKVIIIEGIPIARLKGMVDITNYGAVARKFSIDKRPVLTR